MQWARRIAPKYRAAHRRLPAAPPSRSAPWPGRRGRRARRAATRYGQIPKQDFWKLLRAFVGPKSRDGTGRRFRRVNTPRLAVFLVVGALQNRSWERHAKIDVVSKERSTQSETRTRRIFAMQKMRFCVAGGSAHRRRSPRMSLNSNQLGPPSQGGALWARQEHDDPRPRRHRSQPSAARSCRR